jgi:hypothetical protein
VAPSSTHEDEERAIKPWPINSFNTNGGCANERDRCGEFCLPTLTLTLPCKEVSAISEEGACESDQLRERRNCTSKEEVIARWVP